MGNMQNVVNGHWTLDMWTASGGFYYYQSNQHAKRKKIGVKEEGRFSRALAVIITGKGRPKTTF